MRLPRSVSGPELAKAQTRRPWRAPLASVRSAKALQRYGYEVTRQTGSRVRLTTEVNGQHHVTIPNHSPLRVGTLAAILAEVAAHHKVTRDQVLERLFG